MMTALIRPIKPEGYDNRIGSPFYEEQDASFDAAMADYLAAGGTLEPTVDEERSGTYRAGEATDAEVAAAAVKRPEMFGEFSLDLTTIPDGELSPSDEDVAEQRLSSLLEGFGDVPVDKARDLVVHGDIELVKTEPNGEGTLRWYNVKGSRLYVVKITHGEEFVFAECSCPNGQNRGGDATCYHSIAARVLDADLGEAWTGGAR